jgi:hypothetical protein
MEKESGIVFVPVKTYIVPSKLMDMKTICLVVFAMLTYFMFSACETTNAVISEKPIATITGSDIGVVVVDSCEYLCYVVGSAGKNGTRIICHKGNCRFCMERQKKLCK